MEKPTIIEESQEHGIAYALTDKQIVDCIKVHHIFDAMSVSDPQPADIANLVKKLGLVLTLDQMVFTCSLFTSYSPVRMELYSPTYNKRII